MVASSNLPQAVAAVGKELAIAWSDGVEQFISLRILREACPCAVCEGEPDVMGNKVVLKKEMTPESFILKKYEFVGGYGIQFFWGDGHSTGIYSVGYLKALLTSKNLSSQSTDAVSNGVAPVLESSSISIYTPPLCAVASCSSIASATLKTGSKP